jgi:hypothetical protein
MPNNIKIRELKKELHGLKRYKKNLPRLIDCSRVYGDDSFTEANYAYIDKEIEELENRLLILKTQITKQ